MFQSYSDEEDYLGLGLRDGRLRLVWNLGWYSRSEVITSNKYNDGQWHNVLIERYLSFLITGKFSFSLYQDIKYRLNLVYVILLPQNGHKC